LTGTDIEAKVNGNINGITIDDFFERGHAVYEFTGGLGVCGHIV